VLGTAKVPVVGAGRDLQQQRGKVGVSARWRGSALHLQGSACHRYVGPTVQN
jgi:hypothetical protein